jgi:hypothetical protein
VAATQGRDFVTKFIPNPVQQAFIENRPHFVNADGDIEWGADLFSSRMGEGKSTALAWSIYAHTKHNPGAKHLIIRDTFENLRSTTMKTFFEWFPPGIYGVYHNTHKTFTWNEGVAHGTVEFMGADDPQDATKLMSREYAGFCMDEPAPATGSAGISEDIFDMAMSRRRQPGMKWYMAKLAQNNPDEAHWTFRRFVQPGTDGFTAWQPQSPENKDNLPAGYYASLRRLWGHRPDLVRRFVEGQYGFQSIGKAVTPQWSDQLHLINGLTPLPRHETVCCWDFGHNPTCIITQVTPLGYWLILDAIVGDGIGVEELIDQAVRPLLANRYRNCPLRHIGDPAGNQGEQTSVHRSAVRSVLKSLGGTWRNGPVKPEDRIEPLRAVLTRTSGGRGIVQVDKERAAAIWHALRGGWHFHIARTGVISGQAVKDIHSHPGDAIAYGAAVLFPMGRLSQDAKVPTTQPTTYFGRSSTGVSVPVPDGLPPADFKKGPF